MAEKNEMQIIAIKDIIFAGKKHTKESGAFTVPEEIGKRLVKSKSASEFK